MEETCKFPPYWKSGGKYFYTLLHYLQSFLPDDFVFDCSFLNRHPFLNVPPRRSDITQLLSSYATQSLPPLPYFSRIVIFDSDSPFSDQNQDISPSFHQVDKSKNWSSIIYILRSSSFIHSFPLYPSISPPSMFVFLVFIHFLILYSLF